jgi:hypothetical protein
MADTQLSVMTSRFDVGGSRLKPAAHKEEAMKPFGSTVPAGILFNALAEAA